MLLPAEKWDPKWLAALFLGAVFLLFPIAEKAIFDLPVYPSEVALALALCFGVVSCIREKRGLSVVAHPGITLFAGLSLLFLMGTILSWATHAPTLSGLGKLKSFYLLPVFFGLALPFFLKESAKLQLVLRLWAFGTWAAAIAAVVSATQGWLLYDGRLAGPYTSANYLAVLLAPGSVLALYFLATRERSSMKWFAFSGGILTSIAIFLTHSYATWFALAMSLFLGAVLFLRTTVGMRWRYVIVPIIFVAGILWFETGTEKWTQLVSADPRSSLASRQMIWTVATDIATDHLWTGIGPANFQTQYLDYQKYYPLYLEWAVPTPHNLWLHFWLEGGMLSIIAWSGIVLFLIWYSWQSFGSASAEKRRLIALGVTLVSFYCLYGLVDTPYMKNDLSFAVWGAIGLLMASLRLKA